MTKQIFILLIFWLAGCFGHSEQNSEKNLASSTIFKNEKYVWKKLLESADWRKSYNFQMFSINDNIWTFHHDSNWFSPDGKKWTKSLLTNALGNLAFLDYVKFNNAIYGLGHFEGNIETFTFTPEIYRTENLQNWQLLSKKSTLPHRFFYHPFVFDNKIWLIGGEDKNTKYADIWNSADGVIWQKQKDNLPFGKRSGSQIVFLRDKLYLLDNDVWTSTDALNWQKVTDEIVKGEKIFGYTALVFDNKIWLLGCNRNGQFSSQVLVSTNGKNWQGQNAPWTPRGGIAATVHQEKIYMTGGKYGGTPNQPDFRYSNDVWTLEKKE